MANFIIAISRRKVLSKFIATVFLTYLAVFMFPIRYCRTGSLNLFLLFSSILIGLIFAAVYRLYWGKVLFLTMLSCTVGLGLRILMELGEYKLDRDLTIVNILMTYIPVIAVILISYFITINSKVYLKVLINENDIMNSERDICEKDSSLLREQNIYELGYGGNRGSIILKASKSISRYTEISSIEDGDTVIYGHSALLKICKEFISFLNKHNDNKKIIWKGRELRTIVCLAEPHAVVAGAEYGDALELVFLDAAGEFKKTITLEAKEIEQWLSVMHKIEDEDTTYMN